ncbi:hypothetical protein [Corynebacterium liangguodongii]|uniref:Uncharacterized protein n=1 Tax=Corynebacterium liangguodongii TaxID=2079535 RepID=A0A2S0WCM9_9CORY|nr:hypothetical protein [Corynebacterium liangguodongii]AWB83518.1 hypothetical protein C3E79_02605 [Corynebacterium liangguodongii]PWC00393.1 hypothetical protein DF219_00350 [Corynebacterium liangguodongii]
MGDEIDNRIRGWYPVECALIEWISDVKQDDVWYALVSDLEVGEPDLAFYTVIATARRDGLTLPPKLLRDSLEHAKIGVLEADLIVPFLEKQAAALDAN